MTTRHHIRIGEATRSALLELAAETHESMRAILERAVERERRAHLLEAANAEWATIQVDRVACAEYEAERALWDRTLTDGLPTGKHEVW